jgi:hypothetical protein
VTITYPLASRTVAPHKQPANQFILTIIVTQQPQTAEPAVTTTIKPASTIARLMVREEAVAVADAVWEEQSANGTAESQGTIA